MTRRMMDSSLFHNEHFLALNIYAQKLLFGIILHADDQGRLKGSTITLKVKIFPMDAVTQTDIEGWLHQLAANGTIILYNADGQPLIQLQNWWQYQSLQYAAASDYPAPPGWQDRIRKTVTKGFIATYNWTLTNGERVADTCDERGHALGPSPNGKVTPSSPPMPGNSPVDSPESSPESTGECSAFARQINLTELNLNEDQLLLAAQGANGTPHQELFGAICEAVGWDHKTLSKEDKGQVAQTCGILRKAEYSLEDIRRFMVDIWFHDWRWTEKGQRPTLRQLRQEIGKLRAVQPTNLSRPSNGRKLTNTRITMNSIELVERELGIRNG